VPLAPNAVTADGLVAHSNPRVLRLAADLRLIDLSDVT